MMWYGFILSEHSSRVLTSGTINIMMATKYCQDICCPPALGLWPGSNWIMCSEVFQKKLLILCRICYLQCHRWEASSFSVLTFLFYLLHVWFEFISLLVEFCLLVFNRIRFLYCCFTHFYSCDFPIRNLKLLYFILGLSEEKELNINADYTLDIFLY